VGPQQRETQIFGVNHDPRSGPVGSLLSFVDPAFIAVEPRRDPDTSVSAWWLCRYYTARHAFLKARLGQMRQHGHTALKVDSVGRDDGGAYFVEVHNGGAAPVDLADYFLSGDARVPQQWRMPAVTLPPGGRWRFTQDGMGEARLGAQMDTMRPEVALFQADGRTAVDLVFLPALESGSGYRRAPSGSEMFAPLP
jgi:spore coat protein H